MTYVRSMRGLVRAIGRGLAPEIAGLAKLIPERQDAKAPPRVSAATRRMREIVNGIVRHHIEAGIVDTAAREVSAASLRETSRVLGMERRMLVPDMPLDAWTERNVGLITNVSDQLLEQIEGVVTGALDTGLRYEELALQLQERLGVAESRAVLIARDQVLTGYSQLSQARIQRVGIDDYIWHCVDDQRCRGKPGGLYPNSGNHWQLNGTPQKFSAPPIVDKRTGRRANPGEDILCRCTAEPVFADDD